VQTPVISNNPPGLSAIAYRAGTWSSFKESMLARLSSSDYPALQPLKTRSDDDFTGALIDAGAMMLDVLTFYQERLANESYLRTAGQLRSLTELSRLIGYQPAPGVSASTYLAFTFKPAPGQPTNPSAPAIVIPQGTQVQNVPAQGQSPQTFETAADIQAKADWSALQVQTGVAWRPRSSGGLYLSGTTTQLQPGDSLLLLGAARENWVAPRVTPPHPIPPPSRQWDVVVLNSVQPDKIRNLTYVGWEAALRHRVGAQSDFTASSVVRVFAFRQKAGLFGHNAPAAKLFVSATHPNQTSLPTLIDDVHWEWRNFQIPADGPFSLDSTYQKVVAGSWFALTVDVGDIRFAQLFKVEQATSASLSHFALSAKVTQLKPDYWNSAFIHDFPLRRTEVWAQSDELQVAEQPLSYPLYGAIVQLEQRRTDLAAVKVIALAGTQQKIAVKYGLSSTLQFIPSGARARDLKPGEVLTLLAPPPLPANPDAVVPNWSTSKGPLPLNVADASGVAGMVIAALADFTLAPSDASDPIVREFALVTGVDIASDLTHTQLHLSNPLSNCYDRTTTTVNANVGLATHGQSVSEILGNGAASTPNQTFRLRQSPLTYVQATTPTGRSSMLEVRVNGVDWTLVPSLYGKGANNLYTSDDQPGGATDVVFGDGIEGALLPTGQNNVQANYRIGSGSAGNVDAATLTTLMDRPLGVSGVVNPQAATGGQDPESVDDVRTNAPRTVLTLGRAVSITDYQNFAGSFAGIAKAHALWIVGGPGRGVFLTVAGAGGAALPPGNPTLAKLTAALHAYGNPLIPITAVSYVETLFDFSAALAYDPAYDAHTVEAAVRRKLSRAFSFRARTFGQNVGVDEITAVIQGVPGVVAANVTGLTRGNSSTAGDLASNAGYATVAVLANRIARYISLVRPFADSTDRLYAYLPTVDFDALPQPAEILVIDPVPANIKLRKMS
jgi:hypothetical protein